MDNLKKNEKTIPKEYLISFYMSRMGKIFSNISIVSLVLLICAILTPLLNVLLYILGFMLILVTVGAIFAVVPNYWQLFMPFVSGSSTFSGNLLNLIPYILIVGIVTAIVSSILLFLDKKNKHKGRIIYTIVIGVILVVALLVVLLGGIK